MGGDGSHMSNGVGGEDDMGAVMGVARRCTLAQHKRERGEKGRERMPADKWGPMLKREEAMTSRYKLKICKFVFKTTPNLICSNRDLFELNFFK
jgi:hypothetical protein